MRKLVVAIAAPLLLGLVVFFALVWVAQRGVLFPAPGPPGTDVSRATPGLEQLRVGEDGEVEAWFLPPEAAESEAVESYPVLVFGHGNGELIDYWLRDVQTPRGWGVGVLLVEFPGYGRSGGEPSQESITRAFVDAYDAVVDRPQVRAMVGYGRSLGGGAVCQLARQREFAALILESTFSSVVDMARGFGVPAWLVRDPFDNQSVLAGFPRPILLLHGTRDDIVPFRHAEANHAKAPTSQLVPVACGHNDCARPWPLVRRFLQEAKLLPPPE